MTHASLFSGIGGPEVAAAMLGWENLFHCEINPFGRKVLEYWFPDSVSYEDITKTSFKEWRGKVDVLTGGFPCQPFSYAGKRGGAEDARYLWPEMLRAIDEIRPTWVVGENVAGLATMVEGGVLTDLGGSPSLFDEGDDIHGYLLRQSFTIERICTDLERLGYSVQPVLVPAAAVGAPHRRDRIFILAHNDADSDRRDDMRVPGEDAGESGKERLQERDEVRLAGVASKLRPAIQESATHTASDGRHGDTREDGEKRCAGADEKRASAQGSNGVGLRRESGIYGQQPATSDTGLQRFNERQHPAQPGKAERFNSKEDSCWRDGGLLPGRRWADFPSQPPICSRNDGLPFGMDGAAISPVVWRREALKAYGNAIVPQVMYRIFEAIEKVSKR